MNFIPFERATFKTRLPISDAKNNLEKELLPQQGFTVRNNATTSKKFEGITTGNEFKMKRIIDYRNSFLPQIHLKLQQELSDVSVNVTFKLMPFVSIFISLWLLIVFVTGTVLLIAPNNEDTDAGFAFGKFIPIIMFIFGYLMLFLAFNYEVNKAKKELKQILQIVN